MNPTEEISRLCCVAPLLLLVCGLVAGCNAKDDSRQTACMENAQREFASTWAKACHEQADLVRKVAEACSQGRMQGAPCLQVLNIPPDNSANCNLLSGDAAPITEARDRAIQTCKKL